MRRTIIVAGAAAAAARRLELARSGQHGTDVRTVEQVAERLAGGFLRLVDGDTLAHAAEQALASTPPERLGDLHAIADLPGIAGTLASTLNKAWLADIDLAREAAGQPDVPRLRALAGLERSVLERLPPGMLAPRQLAQRAFRRLAPTRLGETVFGTIELDYLMDVPPCWRLLLMAMHRPGKMHWRSGAHAVPAWWDSTCKDATNDDLATPAIRAVTCATARHEVMEAMRWARGLLATGNVQAGAIAFAAASPGEYDDLVLAIGREASLDVHFAHGRRALATQDGQAAASLADILLHGLSQDRVRRLATMAHAPGTPFGALPDGWTAGLPRAAPLGSPHRWWQAAAAASLPSEVTAILLPAIDLLASGTAEAAKAGEIFLRGMPLQLWRRALDRAPASALEATLGALRLPDTNEAATSIGWMHAATLACCPRPYVWLLGLNARTWPRAAAEDPLLPGHVIPAAQLDPMPITLADRLAFQAITGTTAQQLVCCASRRDATGRLLGLSPLMPDGAPERLARARIPEHAMSEQDRMMARPVEFAATPRAGSAHACWQDWNDPGVTPHDGQVRPDHPALARAMERTHSATSLKMLLRNPLGFTWRYALGWREPDAGIEALELDSMQFGNMVHGMLDAALPAIEAVGGLAAATPGQVAAAIHAARGQVASQWEAEAAVPPALLWTLTLDRAEQMAATALAWPLPAMPGGRSFAEVAFGGMPATNAAVPWDPERPVLIPGTPIRIQGRIDRLDLSADGTQARLVDYKTGKLKNPGILDHGSELQRCLYAYVVQSLLGPTVQVEAALLFPRGDGAYHALPDTQAALETMTQALLEARASLLAGRALMGPDTAGDYYNDLAFALPASPGAMTGRKCDAARALLGPAAAIWGSCMMTNPSLDADTAARALALTALDRTLLVEAGAGSGKTSVLAGRVAALLAAGRAPGEIAAITFTELAAGELRGRVVEFVNELAEGTVRPDLRSAFPAGPDPAQRRRLRAARAKLDELVCTTIHGFCQRLLRPWPVEAGMDPGATVMDREDAEALLAEVLDAWLRERLSAQAGDDDLLLTLFAHDPPKAAELVRNLLTWMAHHRGAPVADTALQPDVLAPMRAASRQFRAFLAGAPCQEEDTLAISLQLEAMLAETTGEAVPEASFLIHLLHMRAPAGCATQNGGWGAYRKKVKWQAAVKASRSQATAEQLHDDAGTHYAACKEAHEAAKSYAAGRILHRLAGELREVLDRFARLKRGAALIDFDDLMVKARDLLAGNDTVRAALAGRYSAVLVDEFQDTDRLQAEILWRLSAAAPDPARPWTEWPLRPGALFMVGDPKQAIYRFRGADVRSYIAVRERLALLDAGSQLQITQNFRSLGPILDWVNARFAGPLSANLQPGFSALFTTTVSPEGHRAVATLPVEVPGMTADVIRDAEADAVAAFCARVIGALPVRGRDGPRPCRPDDIALLAPTGTDLWRYERALEAAGISVSTQAGKGFFRRQEVQDLIALTRVLADHRDTLAFGGLLRGPLVGLTEEALLDALAGLPVDEEGRPGRLFLWTPLDGVENRLLRETLEILQSLARLARSTTPFVLLSQAVEELQVRPLLRRRQDRTAERALANVDQFLEGARAYDLRGQLAFAQAMTAQWHDAQRTMEGRPDTEEQSVSLVTMHASKGLEWPVVIPINMGGAVNSRTVAALDEAGQLHLPVFGQYGPGGQPAIQAERNERERERHRVWYVAATRARDLLLLPQLSIGVPTNSWMLHFGLVHDNLAPFATDGLPKGALMRAADVPNNQDRAGFETEAALIAARTHRIRRITPHLAEAGEQDAAPPTPLPPASVDGAAERPSTRGSLARGLVLHKLLEEVLTGETADDAAALAARAAELAGQLPDAPGIDMLDPAEAAIAVLRGLALPEISAVRARLLPECAVAASTLDGDTEAVTLGIADAVTVGPDGCIGLVVDWKSDVDPAPRTVASYRGQVSAYLAATGAAEGLLVFLTSGRVERVAGQARPTEKDGGSVTNEWSDELVQGTRAFLESGGMMPARNGRYHFKNSNGRSGTMDETDLITGEYRIRDRKTGETEDFPDADALIAAGWAAD